MPNTYGTTGNRWWVGENLTNQNSFRLSNFGSTNAPSGYQSFPSGSAADDAAIVKTGVGNTVSLHNIDWKIGGGPYTSQKLANAAIPAIQAAAPAPGAVAQALPPAFSSVENALSGFYDAVTNGKMWRSLGWLLLGVLLIMTALILWVGPGLIKASPIGRAISTIRG